MQTKRRFYLTHRDKKLCNQFSVHFLIISYRLSGFLIANLTVPSDVEIKKYGLEKVLIFSNGNMNSSHVRFAH